jgi:hypothetical protein
MQRHITRNRLIAGFGALALIIATAAFAAWFVGTLGGSGGGKVGAAQSIGELTLTAQAGAVPPAGRLLPGANGSLAYTVNNPTSGVVTIISASSTGIVAVPACDTSAISFLPAALVGQSYPPGVSGPHVVPNALHATAALETACQNAELGVSLTGTTSGTGP